MSVLDASRNLTKGANDIWYSNQSQTIAYPKQGHQECYLVEEESFWFKHRNDCILAAIKRFPPSGAILDVGGGNGYVTRRMLDEGLDAALLEPGLDGALNARQQRRIPQVICSSFEMARFQPDSLSAVGLFDVVEHIEDDRGLIEQVHAALQPQGMIYLTVPAHQWLWSSSDRTAQHFRRYTRNDLVALLEKQFDVVYATYFFATLIAPLTLLRALPYRLGLAKNENVLKPAAEHGGGSRFTRVLKSSLRWESGWIANAKRIPVGASCLCVARKRS